MSQPPLFPQNLNRSLFFQMKPVIWITICVCVLSFCSKTEASLTLSERDLHHLGGKFCGGHLSDMLSLVCQGKYNAPHKKSGNGTNLCAKITRVIFSASDVAEEYEYREDTPEGEYDFPFLPKRNAFMLLPNDKGKRGIVQECCVKACTFAELRSYCR